MNKYTGIGERLRQLSEKFGGPSEFAKRLEMSPQQLNDYLGGRRTPGNKMFDRLRKLNCDVDWLMFGETREDLNKKFYSSKIGRGLKYEDKHFELLEYLLSIGLDSKEKVQDILTPALHVAEKMVKYEKRKNRKGR